MHYKNLQTNFKLDSGCATATADATDKCEGKDLKKNSKKNLFKIVQKMHLNFWAIFVNKKDILKVKS